MYPPTAYQERTPQDRSTTPGCPATKPRGPGTPPLVRTSFSSTQHQSQPPQFHRGLPASQPHSQRYIIARGRPEAPSLHGKAAQHRTHHHPRANEDSIMASTPQPNSPDCTTTLTLINNIYIYIYVCVCVCVCVWYSSCQYNTTLQHLHRLFADDCIIYGKITKKDIQILQKDLDTLGEWVVENGMKINPSKSKAIRFTRLGLKIHWITPSVTKKFWKQAIVNIWK